MRRVKQPRVEVSKQLLIEIIDALTIPSIRIHSIHHTGYEMIVEAEISALSKNGVMVFGRVELKNVALDISDDEFHILKSIKEQI